MKSLVLYIVIVLCFVLGKPTSSQRYYHEWPAGYGEDTSTVFGLSFLDFNNVNLTTWGPIPTPYYIGSNGAFICDESGKVILLTNGCAVYNRDLNIISGSDTLSPGYLYDNYCPKKYPGFHKTLMLPDLLNADYTIVIHKDGVITKELELFSDHLFTTIIKRESNSNFTVLNKRKVARDDRVLYDYIAAIPHQNNQDWLVVEPHGRGTNKWSVYQINKDTSQLLITNTIGPSLDASLTDTGQLIFSPDGTKMAFFSHHDGLLIFNINRESGELTNYRNYFEEWMTKSDTAFIDGIGYSPNSELLYITTTRALYQFDEEATNEKFTLIAQNPNLKDDKSGWPSNFGEIQLGPDCRLYIAPSFVGSHLHVIHHPNRRGKACNFVMKAVTMPSQILRRLPTNNFYHLATGQVACDSTIQWFTTSTINNRQTGGSVDVFPNPAFSFVNLEFNQSFSGQLNIIDVNGIIRVSTQVERSTNHLKVPLDLTPGLYFIQCYSENAQLTYESKLLIHD